MQQPVVILLAAGRGQRFRDAGGQSHKLHALLAGMTVLERSLAAVRESGLPHHVVDQPTPGMGWSIAAGIKAAPDAPGWLILPADLPLIRPDTLRAVARALTQATLTQVNVVIPCHDGQRGHPVGFGRVCGPALAVLEGDEGARSVVARFTPQLLPVNDPGCLLDVDTPADLAALCLRLGSSGEKNI